MMWSTGSNRFLNSIKGCSGRACSAGFTLIEVLITVAILSLGIVMLYQAFFICMDAVMHCSNRLEAQFLMGEKLWTAQKDLTSLGTLPEGEKRGALAGRSKNFNWKMLVNSIPESEDLYKINLNFSWQEGKKIVTVSRATYVGL